MQLMQNHFLRLNVFPQFYGLLELRLAICDTIAPVETIASPGINLHSRLILNHKLNQIKCQLNLLVLRIL